MSSHEKNWKKKFKLRFIVIIDDMSHVVNINLRDFNFIFYLFFKSNVHASRPQERRKGRRGRQLFQVPVLQIKMSSNAVNNTIPSFEIDIQPGYISGIYFLALEVLLIACVDVILVNVVSSLWYRQIVKGIAVEVSTAEIPGIATSLVGRYLSLPNLFAYFVKVSLLALILLIDLNLYSRTIRPEVESEVSGRFDFNPSDDPWNKKVRTVTRPFPEMRACRESENETIKIYSIAFSFVNNESVLSEIDDGGIRSPFEINRSSVTCMSEKNSKNSSDFIIAWVKNCSQLIPTSCSRNTVYTLANINFQTEKSELVEVFESETKKYLFYKLRIINKTDVKLTFPDYENPKLSCLINSYQLKREGIGNIHLKEIETCLVVADYNGGKDKLIEKWYYNKSSLTLSRRFPGPVFNGTVDIGIAQTVVLLKDTTDQYSSWESFATHLVSQSCIYRQLPFVKVIILGLPKKVTAIPKYIIGIIVAVLVIAVSTLVVVNNTLGKDERPKVNTVNGLSSIAREENEPSGRSLVGGRWMIIGLSKRDETDGRFGPLRSTDVHIAKRDVKTIT